MHFNDMPYRRITYLVLLAIVAAILISTISFEIGSHGSGTAAVMTCLSDGLFTCAVLYVGCSILMYIEEAGNFYGIQYLWHTVIRLVSFNKKRAEEKKDYFTCCREKRERREEEGKTPLKSAMLFIGLGCLALAFLFAFFYYKIS